ncbi:MAG: hypothetical protein WCO96_08950 [Actinomycetes bacterium]
MGMLAWLMAGIAVWHFTIWLPDWCWGGIVGAFLGAVIGAAVFGFVISGFSIPGEDSTTMLTAFEGIPGAMIGIGVMMAIGKPRGEQSTS